MATTAAVGEAGAMTIADEGDVGGASVTQAESPRTVALATVTQIVRMIAKPRQPAQ